MEPRISAKSVIKAVSLMGVGTVNAEFMTGLTFGVAHADLLWPVIEEEYVLNFKEMMGVDYKEVFNETATAIVKLLRMAGWLDTPENDNESS